MNRWNSVIGAAALLLGAGLLSGGLSGCSISPPSVAAETEEIYLRMFNGSPGSSVLGVTAGDGPNRVQNNLYFGTLTQYQKMAAGEYSLKVSRWDRGLGMDSFADLSLEATTYANLSGQKYFTAITLGESSRVSVVVLADDRVPIYDRALVRFVHAVPDLPLIQLTETQGQIILPGLGYAQASDYVELDPGFSTLELREVSFPESEIPTETGTAAEEVQTGRFLEQYNVEFRPGKVYTVYIAGLFRGEPGLEVKVAEQATDYL